MALAYLIFCGSGCLLYTDPINHPPEVELTGAAETTFHSTPGPTYHAAATDPDQSADSLTYEWRSQRGACPTTLAEATVATVPPVGASRPNFEADTSFPDSFCVWVVVKDDHGATDWAALKTDVKHLDTMAVVEVVRPVPPTAAGATAPDHFPLLTEVQLSAARSRDPENAQAKLTFGWTLTRNGQPVPTTTCPQTVPSELCFTGDKDGTYVATVTVTDSRNNKVMQSKSVTIDPDGAPCLFTTMPMFGTLAGEPARIVRDATDPDNNYFEVKGVSDDVDPFPPLEIRPSTYTFKYTWWKDGEDPNNPSGRRTDERGSRMKFRENEFQNGDTLFVRLQVNDRVMRDFSACARDKVFNCALDPQRPTCFQWVTWRVDFKPVREM